MRVELPSHDKCPLKMDDRRHAVTVFFIVRDSTCEHMLLYSDRDGDDPSVDIECSLSWTQGSRRKLTIGGEVFIFLAYDGCEQMDEQRYLECFRFSYGNAMLLIDAAAAAKKGTP